MRWRWWRRSPTEPLAAESATVAMLNATVAMLTVERDLFAELVVWLLCCVPPDRTIAEVIAELSPEQEQRARELFHLVDSEVDE